MKMPMEYVGERQLVDADFTLWAVRKDILTFQAPLTEGLGLSEWKSSLTPKLGGKPLRFKQEVSQCLAIKPDRSGFLSGTNDALWLFDSTGSMVRRMRTPGVVFGVNTEGRMVTVALSDGTIRWYRLTDGEEVLVFSPSRPQALDHVDPVGIL